MSGIDIQNVVANTQVATRLQQAAQNQVNFAPAQAAIEAEIEEEIKKERVQESRDTETNQMAISEERRNPEDRSGEQEPSEAPEKVSEEDSLTEPLRGSDGKRHLIDLQA